MLTPEQAAGWQTAYNIAYYVLLGALFVSFVATGLTFIANNRLSGNLTARLTETTAATGRATTEAGQANERAARLEAGAAATNREAARLSQEAEQTKAQLAWRSLSSDQFQAMVAQLLRGNGSVTLAYTANDPEALAFAIRISQVLDQARPAPPLPPLWHVEAEPRIDTRTILYGISIPGPDNPSVLAIRAAFTAAHIPFNANAVPPANFAVGGFSTIGGPQTTDAMIMIGSKQPPF